MSLQYIFGGSGAGKTTYCLKSIINESSKILDSKYIKPLVYIVPEQFTLESEKELCAYSWDGAIIMPQVLSFQRLAFHLFSKAGRLKGNILDDVGKNMILKKIVLEHEIDLKFYRRAADKQGFIEDLGTIIHEFYQYNIPPDKLLEYIEKIKDKENIYMKMQDLYIIYKIFTEFINEKYIITESTLNAVPDKLDEIDYLKDCKIWVDGFTGFTPQEYKILKKLINICDQVNVVLTIKSKEIFFEKIRETDPFYEIKLTINKLSELCKNEKKEVLPPVFVDNREKYKYVPDISFLEENILRYNVREYGNISENIMLFKGDNIYGEVYFVCGQIVKLVRDEGYRYRDIAIVAGNIADYDKILKNIFEIFNIPYFIDAKMDIMSHPLSELICSAVEILAYNWHYEGVFRFLKTGLVNISHEERDLLENYTLSYGIKGHKWKMESWNFGRDKGAYNKEQINEYKNIVLNALNPFVEGISKNKKITAQQYCERIFCMLDSLNVVQTIEKWEIDATEKGLLSIAREHGQIYGKVVALFDKLVEILGDVKVSAQEFLKIIEAGFKATDLGIIPPAQDQVTVGDMERSRLPKIKALFVVGANEGVLPPIKKETGLLSDEDRVNISKTGCELAPDSNRKIFQEQLSVYSLFTKPKNRLYISFSKGNFEGKNLQPSSQYYKIRKMFPKIIEREEGEEGEITLPNAMFSNMGTILRSIKNGDHISDFDKTVYRWFASSDEYGKKINTMEKILFNKIGKETLSEKSVNKLYKSEIFSDISRLEKYAQCPFAYFVQYDLMAKERKIYEAESADFGSFYHDILADFSNKLSKNNMKWKDLTIEEINYQVDESVERLASSIGNEVLLSTAKYQYMIKRVSKITKKSMWALWEHIKKGSFEPKSAELGFGIQSPLTGITISINDNRCFILKGRIDRVDIMDYNGNMYVKILDYKTGNTKFQLSDIYFGMQLQLITYLDALIKNGADIFGKENICGKILPGGVFYFNIDDPILEYYGKAHDDAINDLFLKSFKMTGLVLEDENIIKCIDKDIKDWSSLIPVRISSKGIVKDSSSVATYKEFDALRNVVTTKIKEIGNSMVSGNICAFPFKKNLNVTACTYCNYKSICQIDLSEARSKYNFVKKVKSINVADI